MKKMKKQAWPWIGSTPNEMGSNDPQGNGVDRDQNTQTPHDTLVTDKSLVSEQQSSITDENGVISPVESVSYVEDSNLISKDFKNELGNEIKIKIEDETSTGKNSEDQEQKFDGVKVTMEGPHSISENTITKEEAKQLSKALNEYLKTASIEVHDSDGIIASFFCNIANSFQDKVIGLQSYASLPENAGLIFTYKKPEDVLYHMGTVKFPIDILFIDQNHQIKKICKNIQPGTLGTFGCAQTQYVLEIFGGLSDRLEIRTGNVIKIDTKPQDTSYQQRFNKVSKGLGINKNLIVKYSNLGSEGIFNWKDYPILNVNNNLQKTASESKLISKFIKNFKPQFTQKISVFDFDGFIEEAPSFQVYKFEPFINDEDIPHLTINNNVVKLCYDHSNGPIFRTAELTKISSNLIQENETILLAKSLNQFMSGSNNFNEALDLFYKMLQKSKDSKIVVATRYPDSSLVKKLINGKIKLHLGNEINFDILALGKEDDSYNIIEKVKQVYQNKKIELYSDSSILKRAGIPVPDEIKQKARRIAKLLDSATTLSEESLENMKQNVAAYEKIKDNADAIKNSKGQYNQSVKRNTRVVREYLIKIRDSIKGFNEIKDISTTLEIINGLTSSTKIAATTVEEIFDLIDELETPDFYNTLSKKVDDYEKNIEDLKYSIKRATNYINTDILGLVILSD